MFRPSRRTITYVAALVSAILFGGCSTLHHKQGEWIFNPSDRSWGNSAQAAADMQDAWIEFPSKVSAAPAKLHLLISAAEKKDAPILLYLHGARWNVFGSSFRINRMRDLGFTVVAVDYRGFGKSTSETPAEDKAYEDAEQAWKWIAQRYPDRPRYIFGHSLGGAIAIELASRVTDEKGTLVEGTFTSVPEVFKTMKWGWLPVGWLITQRFDSQKKVREIGSPLLVVHGTEDRVIPLELGRKLYDSAAQPKRFVSVEGGSHHNTNSIGQSQYREALKAMFGHRG
ncbi:MAG: alpha/beta fold hydrolase [Burkholderiales bacterium]|nr:MAG: alpha/beta fold hydrolase [Burkholderiales bacterium]TAG82807.1 MAG: alpha/beta fold hydrolase [Betaproteobacteria bacterium]